VRTLTRSRTFFQTQTLSLCTMSGHFSMGPRWALSISSYYVPSGLTTSSLLISSALQFTHLIRRAQFDSSRDRRTPFVTKIGVGAVIRGWDEGISYMPLYLLSHSTRSFQGIPKLSLGEKAVIIVSSESVSTTHSLPFFCQFLLIGNNVIFALSWI